MASQDDCGGRAYGSFATIPANWLADLQKDYVMVLDLRSADAFAGGFLPGSLSVPGPSCLAPLAVSAILEGRAVFFLAENDQPAVEMQGICRRLRFPSVMGWLDPMILSLWRKKMGALGKIEEISADNLAVRLAAWKTLVVDVRGSGDDRMARIPDGIHISLEQLPFSMAGLPYETNITAVCSTGETASLAASLLWRMGYHNVSTLTGGMTSYIRRGFRVATQASKIGT